jgi:hypothetical protein
LFVGSFPFFEACIMRPAWRFCGGIVFVGIGLLAFACGRNANEDWKPSFITFSAPQLPLRDVLKELQATGNIVDDARANPSNPTIKLPRTPLSFWQALDAIGKETGIGHSTYQPNGRVALVDRPYRELNANLSGIFRFAFKRVVNRLDEDADAHHCHVILDVAWEPRIRLLQMNLEGAKTLFWSRKGVKVVGTDVPRQPARDVSGLSATEIDLRMAAPPRRVEKIDTLSGTIRAIGAPKTLEFKFARPAKMMTQQLEGVTVKASVGTQTAKRWSVAIEVEHPKGAVIEMDSFERETTLKNFLYQRVWLTWNKSEWEPSGAAPTDRGIQYHFEAKNDGQPLPARDADVTLHFRTPNRVAAFTVPFELRDLPLP